MSSLEHPSNTTELGDEWKSTILATDASVRHASNPNHANETALGYRLQTPAGDVIAENNVYLGTNNSIYNTEAEALAVLAGLYAAKEHDITAVYLHTDSQCIVEHLTDKHAVTKPTVVSVLNPVENLLNDFTHTTIEHAGRNNSIIETVHDIAHNAFPTSN